MTADHGGDRGDSTPVAAPGEVDVDLTALLEAALSDETLRDEVAAAGLSQAALRSFVDGLQPELERVALSSVGEYDGARSRQHAAEEWLATLLKPLRVLQFFKRGAVAAGVAGLGTLLLDLFFWDSTTPVGAAVALAIASAAWGRVAWVETRRRDAARREARSRAQTAEAEAEEAAARLKRERVEGIVRPALRSAINAREDFPFRTRMAQVEAQGLAEILEPRYLIPTAARERLDGFLTNMPGGSIGLSGPRGAGKSSLIAATCPSGDDQPSHLLGAVVSAPVNFEPREFILHLFAELCRAVLGREEVNRLREPDPFTRASAGGTGFVGLLLLGPLVLVAGVAMLIVTIAGVAADLVWGIVVTLVGIAACGWTYLLLRAQPSLPGNFLSAISVKRATARSDFVEPNRFSDETRQEAARRLNDIWFQQSFTSGWSGAFSLPIGPDAGIEGGREMARQQMSLPEIIGDLRRLVRTVTTDKTAAQDGPVRVRIGIDELDKIDSANDAYRFMNEIKVLFGVPGCFFLVSISEDAMAHFERRGLPLRDVFDSSFDDVIRVGYFDSSASVSMLRERVIGMPSPFMLLCHCMAGGLPRDVIRFAREVISLAHPDGEDLTLSAACSTLVSNQIAGKAEATLIASRQLRPVAEVAELQRCAADLRSRPVTADSLMAFVEQHRPILGAPDLAVPAGNHDTQLSPSALARELITFVYFCATVLEFFTTERPAHEYEDAIGAGPRDRLPGSLSNYPSERELQAPALGDQLSKAHQAFAIDAALAWAALTEVRQHLLKVTALPFPAAEVPDLDRGN